MKPMLKFLFALAMTFVVFRLLLMTIAPFLFTWRNSQPPRPNKPYAPSRVRISAYVDGDAVVVSSTSALWLRSRLPIS